jgi:hypothetical protein
MHFWTVGNDRTLYVVDTDGRNFGSDWHFGFLLRVTGTPPNHEVTLASLLPEDVLPDDVMYTTSVPRRGRGVRKHRYPAGIVADGSRLYVAVVDYDMAEPDRGDDSEFGTSLWRHGGVAGFIYSDDAGTSWTVPDIDERHYFLGSRFVGLQFIGFGAGGEDVPPSLDGYVYAISNDDNAWSGNHIFLARVPKGQVLERSAWEFYAGGGTGHGEDVQAPAWAKEEARSAPIFTDPGYVGHPSMTFAPKLQRFILSFHGDSVPHTYDTPRHVARQTWDTELELHVYEGPTPWGPWCLVHFDVPWEGEHAPYLPRIPSLWLGEDGLTGTMLFAGDWTKGKRLLDRYGGNEAALHDSGWDELQRERAYYGFTTRPFRLIATEA